MGFEPKKIYEPVFAIFITNIACRIHETARGIYNLKVASEIAKKIHEYNIDIKLDGTNYLNSMTEALKIWDTTAVKHGYEKDSSSVFFGNNATIFALLTLNGNRMRELALGPENWIDFREGDNLQIIKTSTYGLDSHLRLTDDSHHHKWQNQ